MPNPLLALSTEDMMEAALAGFEIGGLRISPARILIALLLFLALMLATRFAQRALKKTVLAPSRVDAGVAHSVSKGIGYAGVALATLIALAYAGLDVTNLAIVAGALSVGIGFGLQSIVNNFVSGLILLIERPVKVGDRIAVKGHEGTVRRIGVRASSIETSDGANLIIPNSDLISEPVTNATQRRPLDRVAVRLGVAHGSDPDHVLEILRAAAHGTPMLSRDPAPVVLFDAIAMNALEFSVEGHVGEAAAARPAESQLRSLIVRALRDGGIELASPRTDVRLRDIDPVRAFLARMAEERMRHASADGPAPGTE